MVHFCYSKERILKEIAKCKVYCSNCHQKHHWVEQKGDTYTTRINHNWNGND